MIDDTGRRLIRQAQREGRLGTLSAGARKCLGEVVDVFTGVVTDEDGGTLGGYVYAAGPEVNHDVPDFRSRFGADYDAADARELGAFLAQLAEWLS